MILKISVVEIKDDDVFPSPYHDENIICFGNVDRKRFDFVIDWTKVDKKAHIIFCQQVLRFVFGSLFSLNKTRTD